jgi:hypothetical protein
VHFNILLPESKPSIVAASAFAPSENLGPRCAKGRLGFCKVLGHIRSPMQFSEKFML